MTAPRLHPPEPVVTEPTPLKPNVVVGRVLAGRYSIVGRLGEGGMATIFEAVDLKRDEVCAVKILAAEARAGQRARFTREAIVGLGFEDEHVVPVLDVGFDEALGLAYLAMPKLDGRDLERVLRSCGSLAPAIATRIARQVLIGLAASHARHVIHRDVKPSNIFLEERGDAIVVRLLDFGIAKAVDGEGLTITGVGLGTPLYVAPEQVRDAKRADARSDVYGLGIALYEMLAGRTPWPDDEPIAELLVRITTKGAEPLASIAPAVEPALAAIVDRAIRRDPAERFQDAEAFADALRPFTGGQDRIEARELLVARRARGSAETLPVSSMTSAESDSLVAAVARRVAGGDEPSFVSATPDALDRYELGEQLGKGGMGVVVRARDKVLHRSVALKLLKDADDANVQRFVREALAQARVEHANVCKIYEIGNLGGKPFIAMQLIQGASLGKLAPSLALEQKANLIALVADGIHAAHKTGLIHRDVKPSNILVEQDDAGALKPYVTDFGIAHEAAAPGLTVTGQILGTPQYMSPEQARGQTRDLDRRTDVYGLGATLYELLTGEPPFAGDNAASIILKVLTEEPVEPRKKNPGLPVDLETITMRCLAKLPQHRYDSARALAEDLRRWLDGVPILARPIGPLERATRLFRKHLAASIATGAGALAVVATLVATRISHAHDREQRVGAQVGRADEALAVASATAAEIEAKRKDALAKFGRDESDAGNAAWRDVRLLVPKLDAAYASATQELESALAVDESRKDVRERLGDALFARALLAESTDQLALRDDVIARLARCCDERGERMRRWRAPGRFDVAVRPLGASVAIARLERNADGALVEAPERSLGVTPVRELTLEQGDYVLTFRAPGRVDVRYPLLVGRGDSLALDFELPAERAVPAGFVYVPPGRFLFGARGETQRILGETPLHEATTGDFLIARSSVTFGEWIAFLDAPDATPNERTITTEGDLGGDIHLSLTRDREGWLFSYRPAADAPLYAARVGEKLHYRRRTVHALQDWTRFPVVAVSPADEEAYVAWLDRTGRVPRARLCRDDEWERAARGADGRAYAGGQEELRPTDANFDETYARVDWGPDEVGTYPSSRSPFGLDDMTGNASNFTQRGPSTYSARNGGFYFTAPAALAANRNTVPRTMRHPSVGLRVCASYLAP